MLSNRIQTYLLAVLLMALFSSSSIAASDDPGSAATVWAVIATMIFLLVGISLIISTLKKKPEVAGERGWSLADALSEEVTLVGADGKSSTVLVSSTSRLIALLGMVVILSLYLGFGLVVLYSFSPAGSGNLPQLTPVMQFMLSGGTLFAPYLVNQARSAFGANSPATGSGGTAGSNQAGSKPSGVNPPGSNPPGNNLAESSAAAPNPMSLTIVNISNAIETQAFQNAVAAIAKQVNLHFQPEWRIGATLRTDSLDLAQKNRVPIDGTHDAIIYVGNQSSDPTTGVNNALGYHSDNHKDIPYGFIYLDVCAANNEIWTCTLSHEVLELLADPTTSLTATGPLQGDPNVNVYYDLEVCDPTQGDTYMMDGVTVSNFVTQTYFGMAGGSTNRTNYLNYDLAAFGVRPGGYFQYEDSKGSHQVFGPQVTDAMKASKQVQHKRRRTYRRDMNRPG